MPKNYYLMLGVSETAEWTDIRDAYRRLAKRYHPDRCMGDTHLFTEIREGGDRGVPVVVSLPDQPAGKAFLQVAEAVRQRFGRA